MMYWRVFLPVSMQGTSSLVSRWRASAPARFFQGSLPWFLQSRNCNPLESPSIIRTHQQQAGTVWFLRQGGICIKFSQHTSVNAHNNKENWAFLFSPVFLSNVPKIPVFLSFFPKIRHFETGLNCDVLTLKRTSFSTFFVVGRSNHLPTTSAFFR